MDQLRLKLQNASKARLPLILAVYILCQPLIDALTGLRSEERRVGKECRL